MFRNDVLCRAISRVAIRVGLVASLAIGTPPVLHAQVTPEYFDALLDAMSNGDATWLRRVVRGFTQSEENIKGRNPQFMWEAELAQFARDFEIYVRGEHDWKGSPEAVPSLPNEFGTLMRLLSLEPEREIIEVRGGTLWLRLRFSESLMPLGYPGGPLREAVFRLSVTGAGILEDIDMDQRFTVVGPPPGRLTGLGIRFNGVVDPRREDLQDLTLSIGGRDYREHIPERLLLSSDPIPVNVRVTFRTGATERLQFVVPPEVSGNMVQGQGTRGLCLLREPYWDTNVPTWRLRLRGPRCRDGDVVAELVDAAGEQSSVADAVEDPAADIVRLAFQEFLQGNATAFAVRAHEAQQPGICEGRNRTIDDCAAELYKDRGRPDSHRAVSVPYDATFGATSLSQRLVVLESKWEKEGKVTALCHEVVTRPSGSGWQIRHLSRGPDDCQIIREDVLRKTGHDIGPLGG